MTQVRFIPVTATFASGMSATSAVGLSGMVLGSIVIPSGYSSVQIGARVAHSFDGTYVDYHYSGGRWSAGVTAGVQNGLALAETVNIENVIFDSLATAHLTAVTVTAYVRPL